ncbi:MAG: hypothetical protein JXA89_02655 [Anaerolineae bacterium]|nr:hypothetical protein [Anaerolineae bacterium]
MNCIAPGEIQEGDLLAYIEGNASQSIKDHIARCPFCAGEAEALAQSDFALAAALYRADCPDTETLLQYQVGILPVHERRQIVQHIQKCPFCAKEVQRLSALDEPRHSIWEEMRRAARIVVEAVQADLPSYLAVAAHRGEIDQRLYRTDRYDIVAGSERSGEIWCLRGRITCGGLTATELDGCAVRLVQQDKIIAKQTVDALGYFFFQNLDAGQYNLWVETPEDDIVVHTISVGTTTAGSG